MRTEDCLERDLAADHAIAAESDLAHAAFTERGAALVPLLRRDDDDLGIRIGDVTGAGVERALERSSTQLGHGVAARGVLLGLGHAATPEGISACRSYELLRAPRARVAPRWRSPAWPRSS